MIQIIKKEKNFIMSLQIILKQICCQILFSSEASLQTVMSVRLYVCLSVRFRGKRDFFGSYIRQSSHFFVSTFFLYLSIYSTNILSVGLSVCRSGHKWQKSFATYVCCHPCFNYIYYLFRSSTRRRQNQSGSSDN